MDENKTPFSSLMLSKKKEKQKKFLIFGTDKLLILFLSTVSFSYSHLLPVIISRKNFLQHLLLSKYPSSKFLDFSFFHARMSLLLKSIFTGLTVFSFNTLMMLLHCTFVPIISDAESPPLNHFSSTVFLQIFSSIISLSLLCKNYECDRHVGIV